jgi:hypothetical protein
VDGCCIMYYHGTDWDGLRGRQQYLMAALSAHAPIVYLDGSRLRRLGVTRRQVSERITVVRGLAAGIWALRRRGSATAARAYAAWHLRWARRRFSRVLFWATENLIRPQDVVRHDALVYDCMDPCLTHDPQYERRQAQALAAADAVFASAEALAEQCRTHHRCVTLLNNACEPAEYEPQLVNRAPRPHWWPGGDAPVAAYLGSVDWRVDLECLDRACRLNPAVHFVIAGNVIAPLREAVGRLAGLPNLTLPGALSLEEGRYLLSRCTVGLIPFTPGPMNDAVNPVKMYAYAQLGKPMVGTAIRELLARPEVVLCGATAAEFAAAVPRAVALAKRSDVRARLTSFAQQNTWQHRAAAAWQVVGALAAPSPAGRRSRAVGRAPVAMS